MSRRTGKPAHDPEAEDIAVLFAALLGALASTVLGFQPVAWALLVALVLVHIARAIRQLARGGR